MYHLKYTQKIPVSLEKGWEFFSSPSNLKIITPPHLGFTITNEQPNCKMYAGQIITYTIRPLWALPLQWVTEITHVSDLNYFIDEQRFGPYKFWHHEHRFQAISNGIEITDSIYYALPFGYLGKALHYFKVEQDIKQIFDYRRVVLEKMFGRYVE